MHKKFQLSISSISIFKKSKRESHEKSRFFVDFSAARGRSGVARGSILPKLSINTTNKFHQNQMKHDLETRYQTKMANEKSCFSFFSSSISPPLGGAAGRLENRYCLDIGSIYPPSLIEIGWKMAEKNPEGQTDRQTDKPVG